MNIKLFKKLIKDVVIEAIHDELPELINEALKKHDKKFINENINFNSNDVPIGVGVNVKEHLSNRLAKEFGLPQHQQSLKVIDAVSDSGEKVNPYLEFLVDAAANMTPQERSGLKNLG